MARARFGLIFVMISLRSLVFRMALYLASPALALAAL